jgi:hypothetical protein
VAIADRFIRVFNFLANMGLVIRDDPPKVIDLTGREWGPAIDGVALSIRMMPRDRPHDPAVLSVVIRNGGTAQKSFTVPGWMFFYDAEVTRQDALSAPLTAYGKQVLRPERQTEEIQVKLGPGDAQETDLPVAALYEMREGGPFRVVISCMLPDGLLRSNEIAL